MTVTGKSRGTWVAGDLTVLDDLTVNDAVTVTGDITIAGDFVIGESGDGSDLTMWGAVADYKVWWDQDGDTNGAFYFGADTKGVMTTWYGDTTAYLVKWDPSGDTNGQWDFGANTKGVDVKFFGATSGSYALWDKSADDLILNAACLVFTGTSVSTIDLSGGTSTTDITLSNSATLVNTTDTLTIEEATTTMQAATLWSVESADVRLGVSSTVYVKYAVTATSGITTVTQTGTGPTLSWTVPEATWTHSTSSSIFTPSFVVGFDSGAALTVAITDATGVMAVTHAGSGPTMSWTIPVWLNTNSTSYTTYTPSWVLGYDAGAAMTIAVSDTTGNIAITHAGSNKSVTWTAGGGFDFVGAMLADALTLSDVLTFSGGGTIDNTAADTLTITEDNIVIAGNLQVDGTTTTVNTATLTVDDKNIEMGSVASPTDTTADGGGITLKGATDKTIIWDNANDNWTFNQAVNLVTGLDFKINNTSVLNATTLGGAVVASSLTSVGTLTSLAVSGATTFYGGSTIIGFDVGAALTIAVTDTTGVTAVTHAGSGPTMSWTIPVWGNTCSTSYTTYTPSWVLGFDSGAALTLAITDTTGVMAITHAGSGPTMSWTIPVWTNTNSTSYSTFTPSWVMGFDVGAAITVAVTDTTGVTAITHAGSGPTVTWTANSFDFVGSITLDAITQAGDVSMDGATMIIDGSTSVRGVSAGFVSLEATDIRLGYDSSIYTKFAVANTTGNLTITHVGGSTDLVTWTAAGGFGFVGNTTVTGTFGVSGTLSVGLDATAGTLELYPTTTNKGTTTLTMTDNSGDTVTNVNVAAQAGARTYTIPDAGASAAFLLTDSYKTWWSFACGLSGEDTDGAGTNGGGITGAAVDLTTHDFNNSGAGANDVLCKVFDKSMDGGSGTWDDLSTSSSLDAWAANYQLQPDDASEAIDDAFAIGFDLKFCEVAFNDLSTGNGAVATYGGDCGKWQYSDGAASWADITTIFDNTDSVAQDGKQPLVRTGAISFVPPSDWVVRTIDGEEAYWIQWVFTAAQLTAEAIIDDTNKDEPIVVVPNADAFDAPFKATIGEIRVTDMGVTVHDAAIQFVVGNFTTGVFTEEFTWTASQYNDTFTPGTPLPVAANDRIGILITDDAGSSVNPVILVELEATYLD